MLPATCWRVTGRVAPTCRRSQEMYKLILWSFGHVKAAAGDSAARAKETLLCMAKVHVPSAPCALARVSVRQRACRPPRTDRTIGCTPPPHPCNATAMRRAFVLRACEQGAPRAGRGTRACKLASAQARGAGPALRAAARSKKREHAESRIQHPVSCCHVRCPPTACYARRSACMDSSVPAVPSGREMTSSLTRTEIIPSPADA